MNLSTHNPKSINLNYLVEIFDHYSHAKHIKSKKMFSDIKNYLIKRVRCIEALVFFGLLNWIPKFP